MKLGFIGTGAITEAIVVGLMEAEYPLSEIVVSARGAATAARLAASRGASAASRPKTVEDTKPSGTLAEETALLSSALAAERTGQREKAAAALERLLSRYPESPLAPEARAVRSRVARPAQ